MISFSDNSIDYCLGTAIHAVKNKSNRESVEIITVMTVEINLGFDERV